MVRKGVSVKKKGSKGGTIILTTLVWVGLIGLWCGGIDSSSGMLPHCVQSLIGQYSREITILEVGKRDRSYLPSLVRYNAQCIVLSVGGVSRRLITAASQWRPRSPIVLGPKVITYDMIHTLGSCEHFDIVIVRDLGRYTSDFMPFATAFLQLGDHLFIEASSADRCRICRKLGMIEQKGSQSTPLFYAHKKKTMLEKARFTQKLKPFEPRTAYRVTGDFHSKFFR